MKTIESSHYSPSLNVRIAALYAGGVVCCAGVIGLFYATGPFAGILAVPMVLGVTSIYRKIATD